MSDFFGKAKNGAGDGAFEADKMSRINHAQGELSQIKHQIEVQFIKLGQLQYQLFLHPDGEAADVTTICQHIRGLEGQMEQKAAEIQRIYAEVYAMTGPAAEEPPQASL